ncbi:hypothetical protein Droror1_Dr00014865 [Drosera rotundifolia]
MALTAEFINRIFTSSPFLEDVTLDNCYWSGGVRHLCSKSLRRLCLFNDEDKHEVNTIIDAPSLIYFNYSGELCVDYTIENLNSLSKADIFLDYDYIRNSQAVGKFLAGIDMAKDLSLFGFRLEWLKNEDVHDPFDELSIFGNLRKLELGYMLQVEWDMLLDLLYSRPLLGTLVFEEIDWKSILPEEELDPFPPNLKVIELIFFSGKQHEMDFIEYCLLNAELEKLILHKSKEMTVEEELRISEQLMKIKSNSDSQHCSIQLK